jgi:predicted PurR-regulated permease PerM
VLAKKMADVHPIVTVLGVIMGLKYFGITGLIFGPLLISYFFILLKMYYTEFQKPSTVIKKTRTVTSGFKLPFMK